MKDRGKISISPRMKLAGVFAGIAIFFAVINLLPLERPFFPADDSIFTASRYFEAGDCKAGYDVYEKRAANNKVSPGISYLGIGDMKYNGECGGQDIPGAIAAYRKAARLGVCRANFYLAAIALKNPEISGFKQAPPENNFFASALCSFSTTDQELMHIFFVREPVHKVSSGLESVFKNALSRREAFKHFSFNAKRKITEDIRDGVEYDNNPFPLKAWATHKPIN
jgi:hypothetical protein